MKTERKIDQMKSVLKSRLRFAVEQHSKLTQINMLSESGNSLRSKIHNLKGSIKALDWVKNDQIIDI